MTRYLLAVDFQPGVVDTPMSEWKREEITAHLDYYEALQQRADRERRARRLEGADRARTWPRSSTSDGRTAPVVTDGPFQEFKEWIAGFQIVDVESEARAIEIAALVSAVPGPGGVPLQQPIQVRQLMDQAPSDAEEMDGFLAQVTEARSAGGDPR